MYDDRQARLVARHYDASYAVMRDPSGDIEFYRRLAHEVGGPLLELGCGTGRTLLPIARDGVECVGLDASAAMLEVLRAKSPPPNLCLIEGNMESLDLDAQRFRLITCPFRAFSHLLDTDAQLAALTRIRRHLAEGGVFAFDVFDPKPQSLARSADPEQLAVTFYQDGTRIERWDSVTRDLSRQVLSVEFRYRSEVPELDGSARIELRWFHRFELEHLLARSGFADVTFFRSFDRQAWQAGRETIVIARVG